MDSVTFITANLSIEDAGKMITSFLGAIDQIFSCSTAILNSNTANTVHYFLQCPNFLNTRNTVLNKIARIERSITDRDKMKIIQTFLYGNSTYSSNNITLILDVSRKNILETKRFDGVMF